MLFAFLTSVYTFSMGARVDETGITESRQFGRPGGIRPGFASLMYLVPLGVSAMMIPLMTVMLASLVGNNQGAFFGRRRRDTTQDQGADRIRRQMLRMWNVLESALEKFAESDDER